MIINTKSDTNTVVFTFDIELIYNTAITALQRNSCLKYSISGTEYSPLCTCDLRDINSNIRKPNINRQNFLGYSKNRCFVRKLTDNIDHFRKTPRKGSYSS